MFVVVIGWIDDINIDIQKTAVSAKNMLFFMRFHAVSCTLYCYRFSDVL
jgi:hypothetical protein